MHQPSLLLAQSWVLYSICFWICFCRAFSLIPRLWRALTRLCSSSMSATLHQPHSISANTHIKKLFSQNGLYFLLSKIDTLDWVTVCLGSEQTTIFDLCVLAVSRSYPRGPAEDEGSPGSWPLPQQGTRHTRACQSGALGSRSCWRSWCLPGRRPCCHYPRHAGRTDPAGGVEKTPRRAGWDSLLWTHCTVCFDEGQTVFVEGENTHTLNDHQINTWCIRMLQLNSPTSVLKVTYYAKFTSSCLSYINMCPLCLKRFWKFQEKNVLSFCCWGDYAH